MTHPFDEVHESGRAPRSPRQPPLLPDLDYVGTRQGWSAQKLGPCDASRDSRRKDHGKWPRIPSRVDRHPETGRTPEATRSDDEAHQPRRPAARDREALEIVRVKLLRLMPPARQIRG